MELTEEVYDNRMNKEQLLLKAVIAAVKNGFSSYITAEQCRDCISANGLQYFIGSHVEWSEQPEGAQFWNDVYDDIPEHAMRKER